MKISQLETMTISQLDKQISKHITYCLMIFGILLAASFFVAGFMQKEVPKAPVEQKQRLMPYRKAYLLTTKQLIEAREQLDQATLEREEQQQINKDYEELIQTLMEDNAKKSFFKRSQFFQKIKKENFAYSKRVAPTIAQKNQISSWLKENMRNSKAGKEDFEAYLQKEVFNPEQFEAYVAYREDRKYADKLEMMAKLIRLIDLEDEKLELIYNHNYASNEEAVKQTLTQDQYDLWVQYNK